MGLGRDEDDDTDGGPKEGGLSGVAPATGGDAREPLDALSMDEESRSELSDGCIRGFPRRPFPGGS